jgi:hypothetical protein
MFVRQQKRLFTGLLLGGVTVYSAFVLVRPERGFVRFVATSLPQAAIGDFDGDGRPDLALIDNPLGMPSGISVGLSGSLDAVRLQTVVSAVIGGDVDHDGDLDLLAITAGGDLLVWTNDGHGRFTKRPPQQTRGIAGEPAIAFANGHAAAAVTGSSFGVTPPAGADSLVLVAQARAPADPPCTARHLLLLHSLRSPPTVLS